MIRALFAFTLMGVAYASAPPAEAQTNEEHCVVRVLDQAPDGEFILTDPMCFESLTVALVFGMSGLVSPHDLADLSDSEMLTEPLYSAAISTFALGIHFDGANGTGSSISVVGSSCTGGWWNTGSTWANRISSSWNGCYRLRHYDYPNKVGTWADTTGVGQTDNLPSLMNNRAESVAYFGS